MPVDQAVVAVAEPTPVPPVATAPVDDVPAPLIEEELLVEDVSIDGMCGVY